MDDEIVLGGKKYVASKQAAKQCGYAQDYVGQLARGGSIDAQRVGGHWYVSIDSLEAYRQNASNFVPKQPEAPRTTQEPDTVVSFDGRDYVSAARGAKLTGYNADYVGQLARAGKILSRQVGNRWYVDREGLLKHKNQKDMMLASVQAQSVRLSIASAPAEAPRSQSSDVLPLLTYISEDKHLMPVLSRPEYAPIASLESTEEVSIVPEVSKIPIRLLENEPRPTHRASGHLVKRASHGKRISRRQSGMTMNRATKAAALLTVVVVLTYGFTTIKDSSHYAVDVTTSPENARIGMSASAAVALSSIIDFLEDLVAPEKRFVR